LTQKRIFVDQNLGKIRIFFGLIGSLDSLKKSPEARFLFNITRLRLYDPVHQVSALTALSPAWTEFGFKIHEATLEELKYN